MIFKPTLVLVLAFIILITAFIPDRNGSHRRKFTDDDKKKYRNWAKKHKSFYESKSAKTEEFSMENFFNNLEQIEAHNKRENETYKQGLNDVSDLSYEARKKLRSGVILPKREKRSIPKLPSYIDQVVMIAPAVNYTSGFPPIKNQGSCLSCYAFTAISVIEYFMWKKGKKFTYSEQNIVDCSRLNYGCAGGWPTHAFYYIRDEGISNGTKYIYKGVKETCRRTKTLFPPLLKIPDVCEIFLNGKEELMQKILAINGPVSGAMSTTEGFLNYKSGVFNDVRCRNHTVDHAITIVGYGSDKVYGDYWIIRNSWGVKWGMQGYGWVARNKYNACGISLYAIFPCN